MIICNKHYRLKQSKDAISQDIRTLKQWESGMLSEHYAIMTIKRDNDWMDDEGFASVEDFVKWANSLGYWKNKETMPAECRIMSEWEMRKAIRW